MLTNQPHPLISLLVITAAVLITYPLAVRMTNALRPLMEEFLDRRDARRYRLAPVIDRVDGQLDNGAWAAEEETPEIQDSVEQIYDAPGMTNEYLLAGLEGRSMPLPSKKDSDIPTDRPSL